MKPIDKVLTFYQGVHVTYLNLKLVPNCSRIVDNSQFFETRQDSEFSRPEISQSFPGKNDSEKMVWVLQILRVYVQKYNLKVGMRSSNGMLRHSFGPLGESKKL